MPPWLAFRAPWLPLSSVPAAAPGTLAVPIAAGPAGWSAWEPLRSPHLMLSGPTGSGKSNALGTLLGGLPSTQPWRVVIIDGKGGIDFEFLRRNSGVEVADLDAAPEVLAGLADQCSQRMGTLRRYLARHWLDYQTRQLGVIPMFPTVVVIDEAADVLGGYGLTKSDSERLRQAVGLLLRQGRAAGLFVVCSFLRPDVEAWGGMGGLLREQLQARLHLGPLSPEAGRMFGGLDEQLGPTPNRVGYGYALNLNGPRRPLAVPVRVPKLTDSDVADHLARVMFPGPRPGYPRPEQLVLPLSYPNDEGRPRVEGGLR